MDTTALKKSVKTIGPWANLPFFHDDSFEGLCARLTDESRPVWPTAGKVLRAYQMVSPSAVRVVIIGQDPYPQPGRATGLAFAVPAGEMPQKGSLPNILAKVRTDPCIPRTTGNDPADNCELTGWAGQGVLLLNTALTVPEGTPGGHGGIGWTPLITQTLEELAPRPDVAWLLCGYQAKRRVKRHCLKGMVIKTDHPSRQQFFAVVHPFSGINEFLGERSIDWWRT